MAKSAEFILDYEHKQVLVLEPFGPYYDTAIQRLGEQPDLQVVECRSLQELSVLGRQIGVCIVLAHCNDMNEVQGFVSLLEFLRPEIKRRHVRVVITVSKDFVFLLPRLIREGANEVIQQPISPKQLYAKIDRYLDILPSRDREGNIIPPVSRRKGMGEDLSDEPQITWQVPLSLQSDCWMTVEGKTRWVAGARKWAVTLIGPPPKFGDWIQSDERMGGEIPTPEEPTWQWNPKVKFEDPFLKEDGSWKFRGEKPEYKEGAWLFQGKHPKLAFVQAQEDQGTKVEGDQEFLNIAEDSEQGRKAAELIETLLKTLEPDYIERNFYEEETQEQRALLTVNPLCAAYLLSEMMMSRTFPPHRILMKFCEYLHLAAGGGEIEIWVAHKSGWKKANSDARVSDEIVQKLNETDTSRANDKVIRCPEHRAVLIHHGVLTIGAIIVKNGAADKFTDGELEGFAKVSSGAVEGYIEEVA